MATQLPPAVQILLRKSVLPLARLIAGVAAGKLWFAFCSENVPDALLIAAFVPMFLGFFTSQIEDAP